MATKRIIEETTGTAASGDYVLTDSSTAGTKKVELLDAIDGRLPDASSAAPEMDGTAAAGSSNDFARADHVHPSDTSKVDKVDGKGLSTNDYTTAEKEALAAITAAGGVGTSSLATDSVTTPKLADNAVTDAKLSTTGVLAKANRLLGNVLRGTATGAVVSAHGTYAAPPLGLTVDGKSVQDGTPTPSAPVAIDSVESVALYTEGKNMLRRPYASGPTYSSRNVTATTNADGSVTFTGTATGGVVYFNFAIDYNTDYRNVYTLPTGTYKLSMGVNMPTNTKVVINARANDINYNTAYIESGSSSTTFSPSVVGTLRIYVQIDSGAATNFTVYPQIERGSEVTTYEPYVGSTTDIDLQGHELRSLPDGTHDELVVDADGNVTLVQRVAHVVLDGTQTLNLADASSASRRFDRKLSDLGFPAFPKSGQSYLTSQWSDSFDNGNNSNSAPWGTFTITHGQWFILNDKDSAIASANALKAWCAENMPVFEYKLATPVTHVLGTVTLPELPAPDLTAWAVTDPSTTIALTYERDLTIAINAIEEAIADLA